ncbi:acetyl-CoA decarbonylase/synthase complex subunit gamma [Candidatus Desantisbacteria bacterium CG1_02_38_46]|uniref:Acetyl-CoA decarbonylase/synthase complex subunit gamma n=3 Tax=unclassified Candidatus Desantisiibacteriota TaxID=3106372 RepID=A0A2H9PA99_9BACT|nr:MAG: acetyl-CoA decarbonylase/synthase complex subunit gamma [Candidatus Desantisbacteria bacterium CG1_02_38_46]PIU51082.1 MAG: acetyl-CoA decarbonylase/synthase complex subunit gamma [Candidatus Desantisbacteria bacterium CG07_land_8_20_14_0_80_39_15]PIZ15282.1 MAG: acetyl-CoA decarbonylase/synthase complex subunit gamma [Candidatus Desantisbacteria bacterium CG_4_10_14_0_8_um_filter_39_17]
MALTGIEIYKKLPKTNCGKCGVPTCLAFAMQLAGGKAELDACPFVTDEAKAELAEASAPPIRPITIGAGDNALKIGGETVMFRHEKTFVNPPGIAILITSEMDDAQIQERIKKFNELQYERVGLILKPNLIAIKDTSADPAKFEAIVNKVKGKIKAGIVLMSNNPEVMAAGVKACQDLKPLICAANKENADAMAKIAKESSCPLTVYGKNLDTLVELTQKLEGGGLKDLVLDSGTRNLRNVLEDQIIIRRAPLLNKFRPLGFPTIAFPCEMTEDPMKETLIASTLIAKYAGIIVLSDFYGESLFPLLITRMNIFTDPQRPMATKEGIYEIGRPDENSPLLVTTNFSLTYFIVSGEIESSRVPAWLLVQDAEGLSVLTAWAADKFVAETIAALVKKSGITDKVKHKKLIIPGAVARISGELEEELQGWEIIIGPREAAHIPVFLRERGVRS